MDQEMQSLLAQLSPEELKQLLGMGTLDERDQLLAQQQAQAAALMRGGDPSSRHTVGTALVGGIGDLVGTIAGGAKMRDINAQRTGLLNEKDAGRAGYVDALAKALSRGSAMDAPMNSPSLLVPPVSAFGMQPGELNEYPAGEPPEATPDVEPPASMTAAPGATLTPEQKKAAIRRKMASAGMMPPIDWTAGG